MDPEFVAEELKKLVGWGADPKRLALSPRLRELAGAGGETSLATAGYLVRRYLGEQIAALSGTYEFMGRQIEADDLKRALQVLLLSTGRTAVNRRFRAITVLEAPCSIEAWRRPVGPERELMGILADHMA
jgi:hypothetical protein